MFHNFPYTISWYFSTKNHILSKLHSLHVTRNITNIISYLSCSAQTTEELKLGTIGADLNHQPMSTPISIFMGPASLTPANPSKIQPVELQTLEKDMTSVPNTEKGLSLKLPSTTHADSFAQTSQHIKISAKQTMSNESSIPEGMNIKDRIGNLGLMWPRIYATHHSENSSAIVFY